MKTAQSEYGLLKQQVHVHFIQDLILSDYIV